MRFSLSHSKPGDDDSHQACPFPSMLSLSLLWTAGEDDVRSEIVLTLSLSYASLSRKSEGFMMTTSYLHSMINLVSILQSDLLVLV